MSSPFYRGDVSAPSGGGRHPFDNDEYDGKAQVRDNISNNIIDQSQGYKDAVRSFQQALNGTSITADKFLPSFSLATKTTAATGAKVASNLFMSAEKSAFSKNAGTDAFGAGSNNTGISPPHADATGAASKFLTKAPEIGGLAAGHNNFSAAVNELGSKLGDSLHSMGMGDIAGSGHPGSPSGAIKAFLDLIGDMLTVGPEDTIGALTSSDFYAQATEAAQNSDLWKLISAQPPAHT